MKVASLFSLQSKLFTGKDRLIDRPLIHLTLTLILGFLAYSNTFYSPFQWDETVYILDKPFVKDLTYFMEPSRAEGQDGAALTARYIGYLTFALNYKLHGFDVFGYHVVNLAIHLINAILVYSLLLLTFRTPFFISETSGDNSKKSVVSSKKEEDDGNEKSLLTTTYSLFITSYSRYFAFAVALLFVSHPIQTEAVTYVFQRLASLVSLFYLASIVLYVKARLTTQRSAISDQQSAENSRLTTHDSRLTIIWYLLSLLAAILAMKTKENAFTLPVIIALYEFLFFSGPLKPRIMRLLPFLLTMLIIPVTIMGTGSTAGEIISQVKDPASLGMEGVPRNDYVFTQFRVIVTYIRLLFIPVNQNLYHDYPVYKSLFELPVLLSFLFLTALFGFAVYLIYKTQGKKSVVSSKKDEAGNDCYSLTTHYSLFTIHCLRLMGFGILWFFITLSVESSVIPIAMVIDEYRVYLPSVGFFLALVSGVALLLTRFTPKSSPPILGGVSAGQGGKVSRFTKVVAAAFAVLVLILASATYARNSVWKDKVSLWEDVVSKSPNFPLGYNNLGIAYYEKGLYEKAINMYVRAIALFPVYLDSYLNLGIAYSAAGLPDLAVKTYRAALAMYPNSSALYFNLAHAYAVSGQSEKAAENYLRSIQLDPYNPKTYHGLGTVYARLERLDEAIDAYSKFAALGPGNPEAYKNRGIVYEAKGDTLRAQADFQQACALGDRESCGYMMK